MAKITIRIPDELHQALKAQAEKDMRSLNSEIVVLLREAVSERQKTQKEAKQKGK